MKTYFISTLEKSMKQSASPFFSFYINLPSIYIPVHINMRSWFADGQQVALILQELVHSF